MRRAATILYAAFCGVVCVGMTSCEKAAELVKEQRAAKSRVAEIVDELESKDPDRREAAAGVLFDRRRVPLSLRDRLDAITAAAGDFPERIKPGADSSADLIAAAGAEPSADMVPVLEELFEHYTPKARVAALEVLARLPGRDAAEAWMRIVVRHLDDDVIPSLPFGTLNDEPRHGDVFLPTLLEHVDHPRFGWDLTLLSLRVCKQGLVARNDLAGVASGVIDRYEQHARRLRQAQRTPEEERYHDERYSQDRAWGSLLLDLMSCLPPSRVREPLRAAFAFDDARLRYFALASHLRLTGRAPPKVVRAVAASAEVRTWLFDVLSERNRLDLMPSRYATQTALAESDLVRWLIRDDNLGQPPDAIALEDVVSLDTETELGIVDYYVFRFRVSQPEWARERGWMAGVAGGYLRNAKPTTDHDGWVFSSFTPVDDLTPSDHVGDLTELYDRWQRRAEE